MRGASLDELDGDGVAEVAVLAADRLVTIGEGEVEVAHEALLREWPRLRGWLEEDAQGRRLHRHLRDAARGWAAGGRDPGELYRGARLAAVLDWSAAHELELNATERDFVGRQPRGEPALAAPAAGAWWPVSPRLLALAVVAGRRRARPARQRARRGDRGGGPAPGRARARRGRPRPARCCSRARASRSTTRRRRAGTCWRRCSRARPRSACCTATATALLGARPQPGRAHAGVRRQ